jgi:hypothetical protein
MLYMVVETFTAGAEAVYHHLREHGRGLPEGLRYVDSWVTIDRVRCFQLMETDDPALFEPWQRHWAGLVEIEVVPVTTSAQAQAEAAS